MGFIKRKCLLASIFCCLGFLFFYSPVSAATNISATSLQHWAWNDVIGWIDFYSTNNVTVSSSTITGYASSSAGNIAFNCASSPNGNICGTSNFKISNDGTGVLTGYAWSDAIGWISFNCADPNICLTSNYSVSISASTGIFSGWAWNDAVGWISFNCSDQSVCNTSNYEVKSSWVSSSATGTVTSAIFDTGTSSGVAYNSIMWNGNQPSGTSVAFQFAAATSTSNFPDPVGPSGTSAASDIYTTTGPGTPIALTRAYSNNKRYFRYKIILYSDTGQTIGPRVDDVVVNWSP